MLEELKEKIAALRIRLQEMRGYLGIEEKSSKLAELEAAAADPDFWNNQVAANTNITACKELKTVIDPFSQVAGLLDDAEVMLELAEAEDEAGQKQAGQEIEEMFTECDNLFQTLEMQSLLGEPLDSKNAYLTLHAGAGGTESCDWADILYRMYTRYAEQHGFKVDIMDYQPGDEAGIKSVAFQISGAYAYGYLKGERGVHRLVRISPFDSASRRHTSFVALDVTAELDDDIDVDIVESDLRIDTYRAQGAGGQHVNTTDSAVRIVHLPTGIVVQCQAERSQHKNRDKAMKVLKAKIYEHELDKQRKAAEQFYGSKGEIAWGSQIRSYVMQPYTMVKDHRTDEQIGNVQAVIDGKIDPFIEAYLKMKQKEAAAQ
ncbi:MAG: peptide chain release factor 2 [Kiritimatiellaceae bacterium]|nr:peptide chain release factor 2 [Kiritimatiellaceae bacterium]